MRNRIVFARTLALVLLATPLSACWGGYGGQNRTADNTGASAPHRVPHTIDRIHAALMDYSAALTGRPRDWGKMRIDAKKPRDRWANIDDRISDGALRRGTDKDLDALVRAAKGRSRHNAERALSHAQRDEIRLAEYFRQR